MTFQEFVIILGTATVPVPAYELVLTVLALSVCLLLKVTRTGLVIAYLLAFHMGWLFCAKELGGGALIVYMIFVVLVLFLAIAGMVTSRESD
jgi:hypothetical protein